MSFPFEEDPRTATLTCCHVLDGERPILFASHDEDDGMWQFLCGCEDEEEDARVIALEEAFAIDESIGVLADLPCGYCAQRESPRARWQAWEDTDDEL